MKRIIRLTVLFAVLLACTTSAACKNNMNTNAVTKTAKIYFENGSVKEYTSQQTINPFKNLKVSFSGNLGKGSADINTDNCESIVKDNFTFTCENNGILCNGSKAVIKAVYDENAFKNAGYTITANQKEYTITGVDFAPKTLKDYEKEHLNLAIRKIADSYIASNITELDMEYDSSRDRSGWSKSGSFEYTYNYHDRLMLYNYKRNNSSDNAYFIIYELSNEINCTKSMTEGENPMQAGESDIGWCYVVAGATDVTATSNRIFNNSFNKKEASEIIRSFKTYDEAIDYCTYGNGYITDREIFT
ncbi:MAG: hypothetical protein UD936_04320 [Acutalibacteraceae bacterium]|nr:hypothetical protein [Acutalibacteraceae bacterium]